MVKTIQGNNLERFVSARQGDSAGPFPAQGERRVWLSIQAGSSSGA